MNTPPLQWSIDTTSAVPSGPVAHPSHSSALIERTINGSGSRYVGLPEDASFSRRYEAAETDRLNAAHWEMANGQPINSDLATDLPTLQRRAWHEYQNNSNVEGVVTTHAIDIVGPEGPTIEIVCNDDRFSQRLERRWEQFTELLDYNGEMCLPELLQLAIRGQWTEGAYLCQAVTDDTGASFPATLRLHSMPAARLETPWGMHGDNRVAFGVRRTRSGRPTEYYINRPDFFGPHEFNTGEFDVVPAKFIYHGFVRHIPGQWAGLPLLASALPSIAQLRDYDVSVADAAKLAADRSEWFVNLNPMGEPFESDEPFSVPHRRMVTRAAPLGWDVRAHEAKHPMANYVDYRQERMAEIGRAAAMPLMLIKLDSSKHNYSAARFDHQGYIRHLESWQAWLGRTMLTRLAINLARELMLAGDLRRPRDPWKIYWVWQPPPQGDPVKERAAERMGLMNKTLTFADACRARNLKEAEVIAAWGRTRRLLIEQGFTPLEIAAFMGTGVARALPAAEPNDSRPNNDPSNRPQTAAAPS